MQVIRYVDDEETFIQERFEIFDYSLEMLIRQPEYKIFNRIHQVCIADVVGPGSGMAYSDLLVIASSDDGEVKLFIFSNPFDPISNRQEPLLPFAIYPLPGVPTKFWIDHIDHINKADIFYEFGDYWHIWLANDINGGFSLENKEQTHKVSIPPGVKHAINFISTPIQGYSLFIGIESEPNSDIAFVAFKREKLSFGYKYSFNSPLSISIPGKNQHGNTTKVYYFQDGLPGKNIPLFIVFNRLDEQNLFPNTFYLYKETVRPLPTDTPLNPQLTQIFSPEYTTEYPQNNYHFYFDDPEITFDLDHDGFSDITFSSIGIPVEISEQTYIHYRFLGFPGINSDTTVNHWSLYE